MKTELNAAILDIIGEYKDAVNHIDSLLANINDGEKSILSGALFACASFESRTQNNTRRGTLYKERAKQFAWAKIVEELKRHDDTLSFGNQFTYTSGTFYDCDIKAAIWSPFNLQDAYRGRLEYYAGRKDRLAEITAYNIERLIGLMSSDAVNDAHHVWSFLYKCGANYKKDQTAFKKRMTWRATADGYDWKFGLINMYRIFCTATGRAWSWSDLIKQINDDQHKISSGLVYEGFADMVTIEKNGNGNSTLLFTPDAIRVFDAFNGGVDYKTAYAHFIDIANEII